MKRKENEKKQEVFVYVFMQMVNVFFYCVAIKMLLIFVLCL